MLDFHLLEKLIDDMVSIIQPEHYHFPSFHQFLKEFFSNQWILFSATLRQII